MPPDPELVRALRAAVDRDPESVPLRIHLAGLLIDLGAESEALEQYAAALARDPANLDALRGAQRAAEAVGDVARAERYRHLVDLLASGGEAAAGARPDGSAEHQGPVAARGEPDRPDWWDAEFPTLTLADVGGMDDVKRRLQVGFIGPLRNPEVLRAYGRSLHGGLLLYGPPGCGKTHVARATAGEIGARFLAIGLNDVLSMWLGESERHLHDLFTAARRNAPCVVFLDEIDALGQRRTLQRRSGGRNVVNQLLAEMDGIGSANAGVFVLGATNHPWDLDAALLRPGRFDRLALVLPPDRAARAAILGHHLKGLRVESVDLDRLAARTEDFSGADLAHVCATAVEYAMEESLAGAGIRSVTEADLERALREVRPSTRAWFETARNFVLFASDGGLYDELQTYMRARRLL